ncbi:MAG: hypothetical protein JXQ69_05075 [Paludibacteraceae bacterium]|nr:hypothetical protein [Paludibacteraceae bacterium]MBN2787682.1 hypothetical protein [Paludibacteraceae bacterium]
MKKSILSIALLAIIFAALFTSCKDKEDEPVVEDPAATGIYALIEQGFLSGELSGEATLDASVTYQLNGTLVIKEGGVLNIPAGTTIKASEGFGSYIMVAQGGKLNVNGTAAAPVVMTANSNNPSSGFWGGIVINGRAPIAGAAAGATGTCELDASFPYGGTNPNDNSGSITYLMIKYAGARSSASVEHNGITLDAVGAGTTISNLYILESADDGIEFFGGNVNVNNLLVVNSDDDMFDATQGYKGTITNCYGIWESGYVSTEGDPRGVEADGNLDGNTPNDINQSDFTITNMTIDAKLANDGINAETLGTLMHDAIKVRRGCKATISNALVKGSGAVKDLVDCTDSKGDAAAGTSIAVTNSLSNTILGSAAKAGVNAATISVAAGNSGCSTTEFSWTSYTGF